MKGKKLTNEEFIERGNELYKNKYDFSKVDINNRDEKGRVCIICPTHGEFWKVPSVFLNGQGCPSCTFEKIGQKMTKTTAWFIEESKKIHGNKYDYSKVNYKGNRNNVDIICPIHGVFTQNAANHLKGSGCPDCSNKKISELKSLKFENFVKKSRKVHGDKYDYSKVNLNNRDEKGRVCIICPTHGEFWQRPNSHLQGNGCYKCGLEKMSNNKSYTKDDFIKLAKKVHGDKYDYSKVEYKGSLKDVCIICPTHGEFWQKASVHLQGSGCKVCADNQTITTEEFINRSKDVHGDKYDYSKSKYINNRINIEIICHKKDKNGNEHGSFFPMPHAHMRGSGCPKCKQNYKLENEVRELLIDNKIEFEEKKKFNNLKYKNFLKPDFYLPNENIIIECQGEQHFKPINFGGKDEKTLKKQYELIQIRDSIKRKYCEENGIYLIEYTHVENDKENLIKNKKKLLEAIKKYGNRRNKKTENNS